MKARTIAAFLCLTACAEQDERAPQQATPIDAGQTASVTEQERALLLTLRYDDSPAPSDPSNRVADDPKARSFGHALFFEKALSGALLEHDNDGTSATLGMVFETGRVSCAGCHIPKDGFVDTRSPHTQISLAAGWTQRRTPTLLEVAFNPVYNWDGRRDTLWNQALGVMESPAEFNSARLFVAQQVFHLYRDSYESIFGPLPPLDDTTRFPKLTADVAGCRAESTKQGQIHICHGKPGDGAEYDGMAKEDQEAVTRVAVNVGKAMAAYIRQLRCGRSRFDDWLDGDATALNESEQRGAALFVGRGHCVDCHSGPRLTDGKFHNAGLSPATVAVAFTDLGDRGAADGLNLALQDPLNSRGTFSDGDRRVLPPAVDPSMLGAFRTPGLRCIAEQPSFMHTGQFTSLERVVTFHNQGGDLAGYPGSSELKRLNLSGAEESDLVAFLRSLQGPGPSASLLDP
ncbi:MAG TPA: cytochrome c peroxidase [Polyangiales bacterium]